MIASVSHRPSASIGALDEDQMVIGASERGLLSFGEEDAEELPSSGVFAHAESDTGLTAMLAQVVVCIGLEHLWLEDWFLGSQHDAKTASPSPSAFLPGSA